MKVSITVAVTDDDGTTHTIEIDEHSYRFGDHDDYPATVVATRAMRRARQALAKLVPPRTKS